MFCEYDLIFIPPEIMQRASQDEVTAMHMVKLASRKFHKLKSINPEERQQLKAKASAQKAVAFYMDKFGGDDDGIEVISESSMTTSTWPVENRLSSEAQIVRDQRDRASLEQELEEQKREMERMRRREADRQAHEAQKQAEDKKQFQSQQFDQFSAPDGAYVYMAMPPKASHRKGMMHPSSSGHMQGSRRPGGMYLPPRAFPPRQQRGVQWLDQRRRSERDAADDAWGQHEQQLRQDLGIDAADDPGGWCDDYVEPYEEDVDDNAYVHAYDDGIDDAEEEAYGYDEC